HDTRDLLGALPPRGEVGHGHRRARVGGEQREQAHRLLGREQPVQRAERDADLAALNGAREIEDAAQTVLTHDGGHLLHADGGVVAAAGERRLARLAEEAGAIVTYPLHEEARGLLADRQSLRTRALAQPRLRGAALAHRQGGDRRRLAAAGGLQKRGVVHAAAGQKRSMARLTIDRAISPEACVSAVSSRAIVSETAPTTRKSACSVTLACWKRTVLRRTSRILRFSVTASRYSWMLSAGSKAI